MKDGRVKRLSTSFSGMDLVQEISRQLRSENIMMTRLGEDLTLWHVVEGPDRTPNPAASRLMAEHGQEPVTGAAIVASKCIGHTAFPLEEAEAERIAARLEQ
ncbi:hypothetical protein [Streptomyces sp. NPDC091268]|uniref:hypothetical protein n=1 Tax=Streptomyces sp. NPDC091268 TaxID=3365979 RepID=UPI003816BC99